MRDNARMAGGHLLVVGVLAADGLTDSEATRRVFLTAGGLFLLGLALLIGTVWWWRGTRPEHPVLGPLEVMGERRWAKSPPQERQKMIESVRAARPRPLRGAMASAPSAVPAPFPAGASAPVTVAGSAPAAAADRELADSLLEPVDLSVLVGSAPLLPEDLAEIDVLLGLAPAPATVTREPDRDDGGEGIARADGGSSDGEDLGLEGRPDEIGNSELGDDHDRAAIDPLLQRTSAKD